MDTFNPYQAPAAQVQDPVMEEGVLAERGTRLLAKLLDGFIVLGILAVIGISSAIAIPALLGARRAGGASPMLLAFVGILGVVGLGSLVGLLAWNFIWIHKYGQTIGKRILRIRIVRTDGSPVGLGRVLGLRWLPMAILGVVPYLGYVVTLVDSLLVFRESRQCLHDQIADTKVVTAPR